MGTDRDWEQWGATDPYFGVASDERFRAAAMTEEARADFFASGESHVDRVITEACQIIGPDFSPCSALDFGCGVGRLVIPLARRMQRVTAADISPSMLDLARRNCAKFGNISFVLSDDTLSRVTGRFDLVHSYNVLQHISWRRGRPILRALTRRVAPGGCLAVQILVGHETGPIVRALVRMRYAFPPANWVRNLFRGRPMREPPMQLHIYDLKSVEHDLAQLGLTCTYVDDPWPGFRNIILYAHRPSVN